MSDDRVEARVREIAEKCAGCTCVTVICGPAAIKAIRDAEAAALASLQEGQKGPAVQGTRRPAGTWCRCGSLCLAPGVNGLQDLHGTIHGVGTCTATGVEWDGAGRPILPPGVERASDKPAAGPSNPPAVLKDTQAPAARAASLIREAMLPGNGNRAPRYLEEALQLLSASPAPAVPTTSQEDTDNTGRAAAPHEPEPSREAMEYWGDLRDFTRQQFPELASEQSGAATPDSPPSVSVGTGEQYECPDCGGMPVTVRLPNLRTIKTWVHRGAATGGCSRAVCICPDVGWAYDCPVHLFDEMAASVLASWAARRVSEITGTAADRAAPAEPPRCPHGYRADADGTVAGRDWEKCPHCQAPPSIPASPAQEGPYTEAELLGVLRGAKVGTTPPAALASEQPTAGPPASPVPAPSGSAEEFAGYHEERAGYGGTSREFHERAASFLRGLSAASTSGSAEERLAALEKHHHETSLDAAHDLAEALRERAAAYARGLERAAQVADRYKRGSAILIADTIRAEARALAGTGAQPSEVAAAEARQDARWREALGLNAPWPVTDVLNRLANAAGHLLDIHGCDAHGYEGVQIAVREARLLIARVRALLTAAGAVAERPPDPEGAVLRDSTHSEER